MIEFACTQCGKRLKVRDEIAGKKGKCPQCGTLLHVPHPTAERVLKTASEPPLSLAKDQTVGPSAGDARHKLEPARPRDAIGHVTDSRDTDGFDQPTKIAAAAGGVGLLILALSPLFRWINFGGGGVTGIAGDGKIVLGVTIVFISLFAYALFARKRLAAVSVCVGAWGTVAMFWMGGLICKVGSILESPDMRDNPFAAILATQISPGSGLYLGLVGGLLVAGALGFMAFRRLQPSGRIRLFCISQLCALALGVLVAIAVGPERPKNPSREAASSGTSMQPFSFAGDTDNSGTGTNERARQQAVKEIGQLAAKLTGEKQDMLAKLVVEKSRFRRSNTGFSHENMIELSVRNNTGRAVSRVHFHAVLLSPGRDKPWVDDEFNYQITGGLEPGESATWNLSPNMFGAWSKAPSDRDDLVLVVRPVGLDGPDGVSLTGERFTDRDAERLRTLLASVEYGEASQIESALNARDEATRQWRVPAARAAVRSEAHYLRGLKDESEATRASLAKFVIERSRFYFSEGRFSSDPVIELTVRNRTGQTVSRFYCRGVLSSPGREIPWLDETFNYSVSGGIQPGETQQFQLAPNMFGPWGQAPKDRRDLAFAVTVERLDGPDGADLYPSQWTKEDASRLAALERIIRERGW